jgi:hypothetical protein
MNGQQKRRYAEKFVSEQQRNSRRFVRRVGTTDRYVLASDDVAIKKTLSELNTTLAQENIVIAYLQPSICFVFFPLQTH